MDELLINDETASLYKESEPVFTGGYFDTVCLCFSVLCLGSLFICSYQ